MRIVSIMSVRSQSTAILAGLALAAATGTALAHHSFAMFDMEHPIEIAGTVKEFKFVSPHTLLILQVKGDDGVVKDWMLEGGAPGLLVREGMTSKSLKPGDEIKAPTSRCRSSSRTAPRSRPPNSGSIR
jgi:hypothetical protein